MADWDRLSEGRSPRKYRAGQMVYLQGTPPDCFYYLASGSVRSFISSPSGEERVLTVHRAGDLMGEASFFDGCPRVTSAMALEDCLILSVNREQLDRAFQRHPELALPMLQHLARTVRLLSGQVDQMAFRPARWRVANYLLTLSPAGGPVSCTQDDIAAAVSASRVTVSRVLNEFAQKGWVALSYRGVRLLERERLYELCKQ